MIGLKIQNRKINNHITPKTYLRCPQCAKEEWFYTIIPEACEDCGFRWGKIRQLEKSGVRKYYHRKGEIG